MIILNVECINTDIKLSYECVLELFSAMYEGKINIKGYADIMYEEYLISHESYIFNYLDFIICEHKLIPIMLKYKVLGNVYYENKDYTYSFNNRFFGYAFDGNGGYKKLDGEVVFKEAV
jgi:hypothetical protein